jgi:hypothetical protein
VALFPNPTTGPISVVFSEEVKSAKLRVFNMSGSEIGSKVSENCYDMNFSIDAMVPGSYLVTIDIMRMNGATYDYEESFTVIKSE